MARTCSSECFWFPSIQIELLASSPAGDSIAHASSSGAVSGRGRLLTEKRSCLRRLIFYSCFCRVGQHSAGVALRRKEASPAAHRSGVLWVERKDGALYPPAYFRMLKLMPVDL